MQLARAAAGFALASVLLAGTSEALADVEAASHLTVFSEPSSANKGVRVIHPQTEVAANAGAFGINAGYEMDVVSGATMKVYAPKGTPDAVSGATFSDRRQAARAGVSFATASVGLAADYSYGWENDYRSHTVGVSARGDFLDRNFTLALAYSHNFDRVCDRGNALAQTPLELQPLGTSASCFQASNAAVDPNSDTTTRRLDIDTFEPALSWTATPDLLLQAGVSLQIVNGFQSNPYRSVRLGSEGREPQEHEPDHRQRYAVFARAHQAIPLLRAAVRVAGRLYRDTWDVRAISVDGEWLEYLGPSLVAGVRGRYHKQTGAVFFRTADELRTLGPTGGYWTGDRELAPLTNYMAGAKLAFIKPPPSDRKSWLGELEIDARFDLIFYRSDPGAPNSDRSYASVVQAGASLRF